MDILKAKQIIAEAQRSGDNYNIWNAYKEVWEAGLTIPMDTETFLSVFHDHGVSHKAAEIAKINEGIRSFLYNIALQIDPRYYLGSNRIHVLKAVVAVEDVIKLWRRTKSMNDVSCIEFYTSLMFKTVQNKKGREQARRKLRELWNEFTLEEEKETALIELDNNGGLTANLIQELGPDAIELIQRMWHRGKLKHLPADIQPAPVRLSYAINSDPVANERVSHLLHPVILGADIRDAGLRSSELSRLSLFSEYRNENWNTYIETIARMMDRSGIAPRKFIRNELIRSGFPWVFFPDSILHSGSTKHSVFKAPLIRILHLREVLNSPELASARMYPDRFLVPEVLLHILDVEPISYFPELRISKDSERRWRARWAESMGETISTLFMETALDIDLTLLERIPESNSMRTADFKTATKQGELIVYESKGSTDWKTHRRQRHEALKQIGKEITDSDHPVYDNRHKGRVFACSFYGAIQGASRSTLFHVEDPPFGFTHLFEQGWKEKAQRRHFAAVLQYTNQYELAERLLRINDRSETMDEQIPISEPKKFRLRLYNELQEGKGYFGSYEDIEEIARRIGIHRPNAFKGWRIFRGIDENIYGYLKRRELPPSMNSNSVNNDDYAYSIPSTGIIPSEKQGYARGIYSLLNNGAFWAITTGDE